MDLDLDAAVSFTTGSARVLDRRRLDLLLGHGPPEAVLAALDAYANADGGYGWGLEPDLRSPESQPACAMHALEVLVEAADPTGSRIRPLLSWLHRHTRDDGGLPFALPMRDPAASAPFWTGADPEVSSLQMTAQVAALAHRLCPSWPSIGDHPWLRAATGFCVSAIQRMDAAPPAYELMSALRFVDAVAGTVPEAGELLDRLGRYVPADGLLTVEGGSPGEALRPLDLSPEPDAASRRLLPAAAIEADLARLAGEQQPDGGWQVDFASYSPAAAVEWRGYATVGAVAVLRRNGCG